MALINSIRKRTGLLLIMILGALALFVLQGVLTGGGPDSGRIDNNYGTVAGEDISQEEIDANFKILESNYQQQTRRALPVEQQLTYRNQAWQSVAERIVLDKEFEKLGLVLSEDEIEDMQGGFTTPEGIKGSFQTDGQFDPIQFKQYLKQQVENNPNSPEARQWNAYFPNMLQQRKREKYMNLFTKTIFINSAQGKKKYEEKQHTASFDALFIPFASIADSAVSDEKLNVEEYWEKNKHKYKAKTSSRTIDFVKFDIFPSAKDSAAMKKKMNEIATAFRASTDDTAFVAVNSVSITDPGYRKAAALPREMTSEDPSLKDSIQSYGPTNRVYGPYLTNDKYFVYHLTDITLDTVYKMKASAIFFNGEKKERTKKAENVLDSLKSGLAVFDSAANKQHAVYATDQNFSRVFGENGVLGGGEFTNERPVWQADPVFSDRLFDINEKGLYGEVIHTPSFSYIVKVEEVKEFKEKNNKFLVATVDKLFVPSEETRTNVYIQAQEFLSAANQSKEGFYKAVEESDGKYEKETVELAKSDGKVISGIEDNGRQVLKWAYKNDLDVSPKHFSFDDAYIVAVVASEKVKGEALSDYKNDPVFMADVLNARKADIILSHISKEGVQGEFDAFAKSYNQEHGLTGMNRQQTAYKVSASSQSLSNSNVSGVGQEPFVVGTAFGLKPDKRSEPVIGEQGVFVIELKTIKQPSDSNRPANYRTEAESLKNSYASPFKLTRAIPQELIDQSLEEDGRDKL